MAAFILAWPQLHVTRQKDQQGIGARREAGASLLKEVQAFQAIKLIAERPLRPVRSRLMRRTPPSLLKDDLKLVI